MTGLGSICFACARRRGGTCEAFPGGIPTAILGGFDHRQPFGGETAGPDGAPLLFVPEEGKGMELAAYESQREMVSE